ncbi:hypothetical protein HPP92_021223 [Vanilla planifolia]|uniref:mRNA cap-binding protein n=1 Tax=Vanilla planifolia TaxID=51239 RepID=A0A835PV08_VANPL|nr:hypothetical protein HPP92_021223 [Vanilla planifolia]
MADAAEKDVETRTSSTPSPLTPAVTPASPTSGVEGVTDGEADDRDRFARDLKAGLHPLKHKFVFWYTRRTPGVRSQTSYEDNIKKIVEFSTVLALIGDQLDYGDDICGAVLSIRFNEDILSVWNRNASDHQVYRWRHVSDPESFPEEIHNYDKNLLWHRYGR